MSFMGTALGTKNRKGKQSTAAAIVLDYPQENERVTSGNYTFRISTGSGLSQVEVSINGGTWQPCRQTGGYWWLDWRCAQSGPQVLLARGQAASGEKVISARRQFTVQR